MCSSTGDVVHKNYDAKEIVYLVPENPISIMLSTPIVRNLNNLDTWVYIFGHWSTEVLNTVAHD